MKHVRGVRAGPQDLLHQRLLYTYAGYGREQAGEPDRLDVERSKLRGALPPDLTHGSDAGIRKRVGGRLCRCVCHEGRDGVPLGDSIWASASDDADRVAFTAQDSNGH